MKWKRPEKKNNNKNLLGGRDGYPLLNNKGEA